MVEELWVETEYEWSSFIQRKYIMENHYEVVFEINLGSGLLLM